MTKSLTLYFIKGLKTILPNLIFPPFILPNLHFCRLLLANIVIVVQSLSCFQFICDPRTVAHQAPLSMGFPRQEYYSGLPFPSARDLPNPGTEPVPPTGQVDSLP